MRQQLLELQALRDELNSQGSQLAALRHAYEITATSAQEQGAVAAGEVQALAQKVCGCAWRRGGGQQER